MRVLIKLIISAGLIALSSEVAKKFPKVGGLIVSLPLTSILAILWLYVDTKDVNKAVQLCWSILLFLVPSIAFFPTLALLLKFGINFYLSMIISILITMGAYALYYRFV